MKRVQQAKKGDKQDPQLLKIQQLTKEVERLNLLLSINENSVKATDNLVAALKLRIKVLEIETEHGNKEIEKDREDKLIAHGLIAGKSKVLTPCDSCSNNGNCKFQQIYKRSGQPYKRCLFGPFPMSADDQIRIKEFPLDQVNYWENPDIKN